MTAVPEYVTKLGACKAADPNLFFPLGQDRAGDEALESEVVGYLADQYCNNCPARKACYDHALADEKYGIWAGTTSKDRRRLRAAAKRPGPAYTSLERLIRGESEEVG